MPRLTKRTPQVEETILSKLEEGVPLAQILRDDEALPCVSTWLDWCHADETLASRYARARETGEEIIALEALEIIESPPATYSTDTSTPRIDPGDVAHKKLRFEGRLKLLAIWNPGKFGSKLDLTSDNKPISGDVGDVAARAASLLALARDRKKTKGEK